MKLYNEEAEYTLIGGALQDESMCEQVAMLQEDLFTNGYCKAMFRVIRSMWAAGEKPVDLVTVSAKLPDTFPMDQAVLAMQMCPSVTAAKTYIGVLEEFRTRRNIYQMAERLMRRAGDVGTTVDELTGDAMAVADQSTKGTGSIKIIDSAMRWMKNKENPAKSLQTGIADLDQIIGGIEGGEFVVVGARPGVGKSAFVLNVAVHVATHAGQVLLFSREMTDQEIFIRAMANESGLDAFDLKSKPLTEDGWNTVSKSLPTFVNMELQVNTRCVTMMEIRREALWMQKNGGLKLVIIDYLQLLRADGRKVNRYEEVSEISRELKKLAMDLDVPVIALCQLNRESEKNGKIINAPPSMAEARDSGSIEQDANIFISLWNPPEPPMENPMYQTYKTIELNRWVPVGMIVNKNRSGRTGIALLGFDKPRMRFYSIGGELPC